MNQGALALNILKFLAPAVPMTVAVTVLSFTLALILGLAVGLSQISGCRPMVLLAKGYVDVLRGVPLLVQIFFIYFGLGGLLNLERFAAGVLAIGICYSAYLAEIIRSGIESIARGQHEAAASLGMSNAQALRFVILPQATRVIIPPAANEFIACLKDSSLVSIIGLRELTRAGREYYSQYFVDFQTWLLVGVVYLCMTLLLTKLTRHLEHRFAVRGFGMGVRR
ncbi:MAG: amino acid ABC transporter permease [candidate division Zixibacteria bacterium]|nr:amino acid ABC transporter permease [candidate division Zixibacteria bacterium]